MPKSKTNRRLIRLGATPYNQSSLRRKNELPSAANSLDRKHSVPQDADSAKSRDLKSRENLTQICVEYKDKKTGRIGEKIVCWEEYTKAGQSYPYKEYSKFRNWALSAHHIFEETEVQRMWSHLHRWREQCEDSYGELKSAPPRNIPSIATAGMSTRTTILSPAEREKHFTLQSEESNQKLRTLLKTAEENEKELEEMLQKIRVESDKQNRFYTQNLAEKDEEIARLREQLQDFTLSQLRGLTISADIASANRIKLLETTNQKLQRESTAAREANTLLQVKYDVLEKTLEVNRREAMSKSDQARVYFAEAEVERAAHRTVEAQLRDTQRQLTQLREWTEHEQTLADSNNHERAMRDLVSQYSEERLKREAEVEEKKSLQRYYNEERFRAETLQARLEKTKAQAAELRVQVKELELRCATQQSTAMDTTRLAEELQQEKDKRQALDEQLEHARVQFTEKSSKLEAEMQKITDERKKYEAMVPECFICGNTTTEVFADCGHPCHADCAMASTAKGKYKCPCCKDTTGEQKIVSINNPMIDDECITPLGMVR
eukprot:m.1032792 g.1032792  ORF g.1032792 m.1032792 type:complete len:549 (+) comp24127_c0_seq5:273-1919(+)